MDTTSQPLPHFNLQSTPKPTHIEEQPAYGQKDATTWVQHTAPSDPPSTKLARAQQPVSPQHRQGEKVGCQSSFCSFSWLWSSSRSELDILRFEICLHCQNAHCWLVVASDLLSRYHLFAQKHANFLASSRIFVRLYLIGPTHLAATPSASAAPYHHVARHEMGHHNCYGRPA